MISPTLVYFVTGVTDMRKSINWLPAIIDNELSLYPLCKAWFVFVIEAAID